MSNNINMIVPRMHKNFNGFYYKIINSNLGNPHYVTYTIGQNSAPLQMLETNNGIYFTDIKHIFAYLNYGPMLAEMIIPEDATVNESSEQMHMHSPVIPGWNTNKVFIRRFYDINNLKVVDWLINHGADITVDDFMLFRHALIYNIDLWNYLAIHYYNIIEENIDTIFA
jgi:hypothetical protein